MNERLRVLSVLTALALVSAMAFAQGGSNRPMRIIVPVAPGGPSDTAMRLIAPRMSEALGQPIVVDNPAQPQRRRGDRDRGPGQSGWLHAGGGQQRHSGH